jgi:DNA repair exonuclease SbcCD nuclease subunit
MRLLHTADWHLGRRFPSFAEPDQVRLTRKRLDAVAHMLDLARRYRVDAVLCAGDLFDDYTPEPEWWRGLAELFVQKAEQGPFPPVVLLPGNHDPLRADSVWAAAHPFRAMLPAFVHVVDRDDFELALPGNAVVVGKPCRSRAGERDLAMELPAREPGDDRVRIGIAHGSTFDSPDWQTNFPLDPSAGVARGLDYLAVGDTHRFCDVAAGLAVPCVYPGSPEPARFDEPPGTCAIVLLHGRGQRPTVKCERVGWWAWEQVECTSLADLRSLAARPDLDRVVLRLTLRMAVTVPEEAAVDAILADLAGDAARSPRVGVLVVDRSALRLVAGELDVDDLPPVLSDAVQKLAALVDEAPDDRRTVPLRALAHLRKLLLAERA